MPKSTVFPVIKHIKPQSSFYTPISYYSIRIDRTPPQNELFNLCLITDENSAYLKMFETYSNKHVFIAPQLSNITSILLAPAEYDWNISYIDLEVHTPTDENTSTVTIQRFVCYDGNIHTQCLFVPERTLNEQAMIENNQQYITQKNNTNKISLMLLTGGSAIIHTVAGLHNALVFAFGCAIGILYQLLLQYEVDRMGKNQMFINSATRLSVVSVIVAIVMSNSTMLLPTDIWIGTCGFLVQKVAMLLAFM